MPSLVCMGTRFPHDTDHISVGEPHGGLVMEKLGLCCADMSIKHAPEERLRAFQRTMDTQLRVYVSVYM